MATYYVSHTGSNTAPYDTEAKAATTLATALAAATASGSIILVDHTHTGDNAIGADTTWTVASPVLSIISYDFTNNIPAVMGTGAWLGSSAASWSVIWSMANRRVYRYGLTFRFAGSSAKNITHSGDGGHLEDEDVYYWPGSVGTSNLQFGSQDQQFFIRSKNCTYRTEAAGTLLRCQAKGVFEGLTLSSAGTSPSVFMDIDIGADPGGSTAEFLGCDLSFAGSGTLVADNTGASGIAWFRQCKLGSGYVMLATQTNLNRSSAEVYIFDCASGDTHGLFGYANAMGSVVSDTGIYFTSGAAAQSWKIVTTANCSYYTPFETPWFGYYNTGTSAITPYVEILRDGLTTAYQDDEVWMDIAAKVTTTSTISTLYSDRMTLLGTAANQDAGAGLGSWAGEAGTAWSGKLALGSTITPAESGHIQARIVVGEPSITVYADPQVRT